MSYDRYSRFRRNGKISVIPNIVIKPKSSDYFEVYRRGKSRLDIISNDYYGDPNYDWLILMANPSLGSLEYEIPDGSELRIPYPLNITLESFNDEINRYNLLYGNI